MNIATTVPASTIVSTTTTAPSTTITVSSQPETAVKGDEFCVAFLAAMAAENTIDLDNGTPESLEASTAAALEAVKAAQTIAPKDFHDVATAFVEFLSKFQSALADNRYDRVAFASSTAGQAILNDPAGGTTFNAIDAYLGAKCL